MTLKQRGALVRARNRLQRAEAGIKGLESKKTVLTEDLFDRVLKDLLFVVAEVREIRIEIFEGVRPADD